MEENKKCENKCCGSCCMGHHGMMMKCHMAKKIICIIIVIIAFCLGTQVGEFKSEARYSHFNRGEMMNWGYRTAQPLSDTGTIILPGTPATPSTVAPAPKAQGTAKPALQ